VPWRTYVKLEENERHKAAVAGGAEGAAAKDQLRAERTREREERRAKKMATRTAAKTKRNTDGTRCTITCAPVPCTRLPWYQPGTRLCTSVVTLPLYLLRNTAPH